MYTKITRFIITIIIGIVECMEVKKSYKKKTFKTLHSSADSISFWI